MKYKNECIEVLNEEASNEDMMDSIEQDDYDPTRNKHNMVGLD